MNALLKHQIDKYLSNKNVSNEDLMAFIDAVNTSYDNFDDQYQLQQRATAISSQELIEANNQLKKETQLQRNIIDQLNTAIEAINSSAQTENKKENKENTLNLNPQQLAEFINKQTNEISHINKQREKLMNELESQNEELDNYAYLVSHDLKSPLRSIDALTSWLKQESDDSKAGNNSENLKLIRDNVEKMDNLISGILNYSTINKKQSQVYQLETKAIIDEILAETQIPEHILIKIAPDMPTINGDKFRIKQLFKNLIDNAIKYNNKKQGLLEIGNAKQPNHWQFYVKDNGVGIDKQYFDKIFKPFQKLENNSTATGIGLSIAKKIVLAYEGKIWVESAINIGTTIHFTIKK
ncbi:sensor histidine kinase [Algibacter sp. PT7-4]|uniref:sensor histidine kinase n=1 Tax=Algibacter ulvanivorans TaxID=3400999 RepID=UPI003AAF6B22